MSGPTERLTLRQARAELLRHRIGRSGFLFHSAALHDLEGLGLVGRALERAISDLVTAGRARLEPTYIGIAIRPTAPAGEPAGEPEGQP